MKKKVTLAIIAVLLVILVVALIAFLGKGAEETVGPEATTEGLNDRVTEENPPEVTTGAAEEETVLPLEDSIFDVEPEDPTEAAKPEATKPEASAPEATKPEASAPETMEPDIDPAAYERFQNMSPSEQKAYMESFPSVDAFFAWLNAAKAAYEAANPAIDVGDGTIDIGDIIEDKN